MAYTEPDEEWLFEHPRDQNLLQPPSWMRLKEGGFMTVYYDNIFAIGTLRVICELERRMKRNFVGTRLW